MNRFMKVSMNLVAVVVILFSNGLPMKVNAFEANDSLLTKKVVAQNLNDDLKQSKISVPGFQMFKKADNEIIAQMNEQIAELYNFKWISFGFEKADLMKSLKKMKLLGIDRVVPFGKTTDFDLIWDGYDLIYTLSRECVVI